MAKHFVDQDGSFIGTFIDGARPQVPGAVEVPTQPMDGRQVWTGQGWVWPLDLGKAEKIAAIKRRYNQALLSVPCPLAGGRPIQLDKDSQGNIGDATQQATVVKNSGGAVAWPQRMIVKGWRMEDNSWYPLATPDAMVALGLWAAHEVERLRDVAWGHIDAVRAMTSSEEVDSYDISTGW